MAADCIVQDEDDWNLPMAAATCLSLIAGTVKDAVVAEVMPFVQQHINNPSWKHREAATLAFGSILEGPQDTYMATLIQSAFPLLLEHMRDPHTLVKDTTAWTLGRICQCHPALIRGDMLTAIMTVFVAGLSAEPRVAGNIAWAVLELANHTAVSTCSMRVG
jgi:importin subunit beta-1